MQWYKAIGPYLTRFAIYLSLQLYPITQNMSLDWLNVEPKSHSKALDNPYI